MSEKFGIYVHWPFCISKCPYCDFNSHLSRNPNEKSWLSNIAKEIDFYKQKIGKRNVTSIFFGGGTPSLVSPKILESIILKCNDSWSFDNRIEITLEANPSSIEIKKFRDCRAIGINRISIGVQSFEKEALKFLGRSHTGEEAKKAIKVAKKIFDNFSFDLIYARPGQSIKEWKQELNLALSLAGNHFSLYQLTVEPGTPFYEKKVPTPDSDISAEFYETTQEITNKNGFPAYEVSNHSIPGSECCHNVTYWTGGDYIGLGPGAHGRFTVDGSVYAAHQIYDPASWSKRVAASGHGTAESYRMDFKTRAEELVMLGLRTKDGLNLENLKYKTGLSLAKIVNLTALDAMISYGLLEKNSRSLKSTLTGKLCLNLVLKQLLT